MADKVPLKNLSYSAMMAFLSNPFIFERSYIKREFVEVNTPATTVGKAFHKCLEMYYRGHNREQALEVGFMLIHDIEDKIDFGKTGSLEKVLNDYRATVNNFFEDGECFVDRQAVKETEFSMQSLVEGISVPVKAVADLVTASPEDKNRVRIFDFKKVSSLSDESSIKPEYLAQSVFNYWASSGVFRNGADSMVFLEVKTSRNRDKGIPQCAEVLVDFSSPEFLETERLIRSIVTSMLAQVDMMRENGMPFLPNLRDQLTGEESWAGWSIEAKPTAQS